MANPNYIITLIAIVLAIHGVNHMLFVVTLIGLANWGQTAESWFFSRVGGCRAEQFFGSIIWLGATLAFLGAAIGLFFLANWWQSAAIWGAAISIFGLVLFWKNPPSWLAVAALVVDILILIALLGLNWPPPAWFVG